MLEWEKIGDNLWYAATSLTDCEDGEVWRIEKTRDENSRAIFCASLYPQSTHWNSSTLEGAKAVCEHYEKRFTDEQAASQQNVAPRRPTGRG